MAKRDSMGWGDAMHKAFAGHFLDADSGKAGRNQPKYAARYANPVSDWVALLIADTKSRDPFDPNELTRQRLDRERQWRLRMAAQDEMAGLPLFEL